MLLFVIAKNDKIIVSPRQRSLSAKILQERMYDTLPKSLKSEVLVKSKVEDPDKREERRRLTQVMTILKKEPMYRI